MGNKKSKPASKPKVRKATKQPSATSKGATVSPRGKISMVQNVLLVWLDNNIDEKNSDCQNTLTQLRRVINTVDTFTDRDQCIDFLTDIDTVKVFMIISAEISQNILPLIHNITQLDSVFIFCDNRKRHEKWAKEWPKIKGVFTNISPICEALKEVAQQCEHNAIGMSFMSNSSGASKTTSDQLDCSFMYTQIMKEILLTIQFEEQHIQEYIKYCQEAFTDSNAELMNIRKLERKYRQETPIWWYTLQCFLYPMLNRALRTMT
jgi:hypothetical protein